MKRCIYSWHIETLSRSQKRNAVQMAAYLTGRPIENWETGRTFVRRTQDSEIREWMVGTDCDPELIFNLAELTETRKDSVVARHIIVALPREMTPEKHAVVLHAMAAMISQDLSTPVLAVAHLKAAKDGKPNPHGHLLFPTRNWSEEDLSFSPHKNRTLDEHSTGSVRIEAYRKRWEQILNENLPSGLLSADCRSHLKRRDNLLPLRHLGKHAIEWEKRTRRKSRAREINYLIEQHNQHVREGSLIDMRIEELEAAIVLEEKSCIAHTLAEEDAASVLEPLRRQVTTDERIDLSSPSARDGATADGSQSLSSPWLEVAPAQKTAATSEKPSTARARMDDESSYGLPDAGLSSPLSAGEVQPSMSQPNANALGADPQSSMRALLQKITASANREVAASARHRVRGKGTPDA